MTAAASLEGIRVTCADSSLSDKQIALVFNQTFFDVYRTRLMGGAQEPLYRPASNGNEAHIIHYSHDYPASALHEVAHWCVAGHKRRQQEDYGYWYAPDGRTAKQQCVFEQVEVLPQALEWIFSVASARQFRVSADNLAAGLGPSEAFKQAIWEQVMQLCQQGLAERPAEFVSALSQHSGVVNPLSITHFRRESV